MRWKTASQTARTGAGSVAGGKAPSAVYARPRAERSHRPRKRVTAPMSNRRSHRRDRSLARDRPIPVQSRTPEQLRALASPRRRSPFRRFILTERRTARWRRSTARDESLSVRSPCRTSTRTTRAACSTATATRLPRTACSRWRWRGVRHSRRSRTARTAGRARPVLRDRQLSRAPSASRR